jgi:hypothetical protein
MTKTEIANKARALARVSSSGASDPEVLALVDQGFLQFSQDVHGIEGVDFLSVKASFTPRSGQAFHLTITGSTNNDIDSDIQVGTSTAVLTTGAIMAANLQTAIRAAIGAGADLTVVWTNFYFTIDAIDSATIDIDAPDAVLNYFDATDLLFGGVLTGTTSCTSGFPEGCTVYADLPTGAINLRTVMWDQYLLEHSKYPSDFTIPLYTGTPTMYRIYMGMIQLSPTPTEQKQFYVEYTKNIDTEALDAGDEITDIEDVWQRYIAYWVASELLVGTHEDNLMKLRYSIYQQGKNKYIAYKANQNTGAVKKEGNSLWYRVR